MDGRHGDSTQFYTASGGTYNGSITYNHENSTYTPVLSFYLYHSQNLSIARDLGDSRIRFQVIIPVDDLNVKITYVDINIEMRTALYQDYYYESAIAPGEEFELFATTQTDITNKSKFSAYYALYLDDFSSTKYVTDYFDYQHVLVSRDENNTPYVLPEGTKITMLDRVRQEFYYYIVTAQDELDNKYIYKFSDFIGMGTDNLPFDEQVANLSYYNETHDIIYENFIFQVDFKETNIRNGCGG